MKAVPPRIDFLLHLLARADGLDRSWSITAQGRAEERVLFYFESRKATRTLLADAAAVLGLPEPTILRWERALDGADAIGMTINQSLSSIRLYAQHWDLNLTAVLNGDLSPFPLYRGFKALPGGVLRDDVYLCEPLAPREVFWPVMEQKFRAFGLDCGLMARAFGGLVAENCMFTRTDAPGRKSWLATVRKAPIQFTAWRAALAGLPDSDWADELRLHANRHTLLHVAGGEDRLKGSFLTLYFEAEAEDVRSFIDRMVFAPPSRQRMTA